ncbi:TetR/AcrR family transcriptional regulator [Kutzneria kofuensis]|jgi:AcrR family transcriptional regulator|uniref:AcrR family transcriptional regulator n=1 Tax=Kutzneria kofuensis TaxID=103725 RepID=A0A7W9KMQ6_9PSEU|nr:TetR/AcrR family transcriptional regulator [Kutzneria kofuensis]MBB5895143.1 AcrR family transcriptional regulator [Kutzneria kofuensis]
MSERLTAKGRATRDRIVSTAATLMFERGVAGTSTEDVQAAAGVSTSQIYHYFRDKKALVRAVIAHQTEVVVGHQEAVLAALDSMASLRAWADAIVALQRRLECKGGCPIGSLGAEIAEHDADARADVVAGFDRWERAIRDGLHAMRDRGELRREADPDRLAIMLLATLQGALALTQLRRDTVLLRIALTEAIDHIESFTA